MVGEEENYTSDSEDQERIDLRLWSAPGRWQEGATDWQYWSNRSGLSFRDVVGPPWGEEIEGEAEEQDGEVRRSTYTDDDDGYIHETEVRVRMVRMEED